MSKMTNAQKRTTTRIDKRDVSSVDDRVISDNTMLSYNNFPQSPNYTKS